MSRKIPPRRSKFEAFVRSYGVEKLAADLGIRGSAVYHWLRGSTAPRPTHAEIIQRVARDNGFRLTLDQIYAHSQKLRAEVAAKGSVAPIGSPAAVAAVV